MLTQAFLIPGFYQPPEERERDRYQYEEHGENVGGLLRFASALVKYDFDMVLDLHDVLRTMIIRTLFRLNGRRGVCRG